MSALAGLGGCAARMLTAMRRAAARRAAAASDAGPGRDLSLLSSATCGSVRGPVGVSIANPEHGNYLPQLRENSCLEKVIVG